MSGFLLDTNVISELVKHKPEPKVTAWIDSIDENLLYLSVLTLGEIRKGIASLRDASRRVTLEAWLQGDLILRFAGRILPIDHSVADRWGRITAAAAAKSPLPMIDGLLGGHRSRSEPHTCDAEHEGYRSHGGSDLQSLEFSVTATRSPSCVAVN